MNFEPTPKTSNLKNYILALLALSIVGCTSWLVVLYNRKVDYVNGTAKIKEDKQLLEAQSVEAKEKIFSLLGSGETDKLAAQLGLVKENHPEYIEVQKPWVSASRY